MISWPGKIRAGSTSSAMVSWVDLMPTLVDLVGGSSQPNLDGRSFAGVLYGTRKPFRDVIFTTHTGDSQHNLYPMRAVRDARYKYIRNFFPESLYTTHIDKLRKVNAGAYWDSWEREAKTDPRVAALVLRYYLKPAEEFYDLKEDPEELNNLAGDARYVARIAGMRADLKAWMLEQGDTLRVRSNFQSMDYRKEVLDAIGPVAEEFEGF
jgi:N-sulfoglucosamine sulfohydrolase